MLELRSKQNGMIGDQNHTPTVFGGDWSATHMTSVFNRNCYACATTPIATAGYALPAATTSRKRPTTGYSVDLRIEVVSISADTAQLRIRYGDQKPDPQVAPLSVQNRLPEPGHHRQQRSIPCQPGISQHPLGGPPEFDHRTRPQCRKLRCATGSRRVLSADSTVSLNSAFRLLGAAIADVAAGGTTDIDCDVPWFPPVDPQYSARFRAHTIRQGRNHGLQGAGHSRDSRNHDDEQCGAKQLRHLLSGPASPTSRGSHHGHCRG